MLNPYIATLPLAAAPPSARTLTPARLMTEAGLNTGNLLFASSLLRVVAHRTERPALMFDPSEVRETHDGIVLTAANWLQGGDAWDRLGRGLAERIEAADLPCVIVGLGAQAMRPDEPFLPGPGMERLVRAATERSARISVRGPFTAERLAGMGIDRVQVTGCPSLLWRVEGPATLRRGRAQGRGEGPPRWVANATFPTDQPPRSTGRKARLERALDALTGRRRPDDPEIEHSAARLLMRAARETGRDYVVQSETALLPGAEADPAQRRRRDRLLAYVFGQADAGARAFLRDHARVFDSAEAWIEWMAGQDLVVGMRLHGVIAGLLAGAPGVLVTHDMRTREMAEHAAIPSLDAADLLEEGVDPERLLARAEAGADAFEARQVELYRGFREFFEVNEIPTRLNPEV